MNNLFQVGFCVKPALRRPAFWDAKSGVLMIWLFAENSNDAKVRAQQVLGALPYEYAADEVSIAQINEPSPDEAHRSNEDIARDMGLCVVLVRVQGESSPGSTPFTDLTKLRAL